MSEKAPRLCVACQKTELRGYPPDVSVCRACDLPRHVTLRWLIVDAPEYTVAGTKLILTDVAEPLPDGRFQIPAWLDLETGDMTPLTPQKFIDGSKWVFAKTMPDSPHEYTVRDLQSPDAKRSTCLSHDTFEWFVKHIRKHGERRKWRRSILSYLEVDGWKYWTMGAPPEVTTIINREKLIPVDNSHLSRLFDD
jgi:hypothetical protein